MSDEGLESDFLEAELCGSQGGYRHCHGTQVT